jgi:hypothetical protein
VPELVIAIDRDEPKPMRARNPELPRALVSVVSRCLEKKPENRYADGGKLVGALESVEATPRPHGRRAIAVAAAIAVVMASGFAWSERGRGVGVRADLTASSTRVPASAAPRDEPAVTLRNMPPPRSSSPEALAEYAAALQSMCDSDTDGAAEGFVKAATLDPSLAVAYLRAAMLLWRQNAVAAMDSFHKVVVLRATARERKLL